MSSTENVSEHLQVQGLEVQDSHNEIVKDLADVRHQAQDIYQKLGTRNVSTVKSLSCSHCTQIKHFVFFFWSLANQTTACWSSCSTSTRRLNTTVT